ncbi:MAG: hypothetical protein SNF68_03495 [Rikenellaceae bacterium]
MTIGEVVIYLIEVALFMGVFYLFNTLFLARDTYHKLNRYIWLSTIVASFLLPLAIGGGEVGRSLTTLDASVEVSEMEVEMVQGVRWLELMVNIVFGIYLVGVVWVLTQPKVTLLALKAYI